MNTNKRKDIIYIEGQDQFRGWFNSSLLISMMINKKPPFKRILSHGFVVDENGKKMSKSLGNVINPDDLLEKYGIDVIRMWVASSNFTKEIKISLNIIEKIEENYQKIRNSLRFILGNLNSGDKSMIKKVNDLSIENLYILIEINEIRKRCDEKYEKYDFASICSILINFLTNNLSSFFFEISKDILYCSKISSEERKEIITIFYYNLIWILEIIAPIFPYLSEEVYKNIPENFKFSEEKSIHLLIDFPRLFISSNKKKKNKEIMNDFIIPIRKEIYKLFEELKKGGEIKNSDQTELTIILEESKYLLIKKAKKINLEKILIVSKIEIKKEKKNEILESNKNNNNNYLLTKKYEWWSIIIKETKKKKCERCKKYRVEEILNKFCGRCKEIINTINLAN